MMESIDKLKTKRKLVRSSCTKLITNIDTFVKNIDTDSEADHAKLSEYLLNLEDKQINLKSLNEKIEELITDETQYEAEVGKSLEYDESIFDSKLVIRSKLKEFKIEQAESKKNLTVSNLNHNTLPSVNLPKLNIPTFSGDPSKFLEFFSSFESTIDSNASLSDIDKFLYLKSFLTGEASKTIAGFALKEENYRACLTLLKDRYGKHEQIISCFINKLLELQPVKFSSNIKGLRTLYDECEVSIRNLQSMGVASHNFGHLLIPILLRLLPHNLVVEFHRKRNPNKIGEVDELMKFIKFEIESRESANLVSGLSLKTPETFRSKDEYVKSKPKIKTNIPTSAALNAIVKKVCIFCNSHLHTGLACKIITNEQKRYKLKKEGRCYRCFYKHLQSACKVKIQPCETCESSQHNYLFCPKSRCKNTDQNQKLTESTLNPENETVMSSVHKLKNSTNSYTTLLQTACVQVESGSKKLITRILYDSASSKTFIRSDLAKELNAKVIRKEKLLIYTFSKSNPIESIFECVNITLRSRYFPYVSINIEALITDEICGIQLHSPVNPQLLQNIISDKGELADSFEIESPIQILLGADQMYQTLVGSLTKINKRLFLQETVFGNTLVGQISHRKETDNQMCFNICCSSKENDLTNLWNMESFLSNKDLKLNSDNLSMFENKLRFINDRYEAPLLWKSHQMRDKLSDNYENAKKSFIYLEKRFKRDESLFERYNDVIKEQLKEGIIEICNAKYFIGYTMPHREVFKEDSHSSKTRVIFNGSSKIGCNYSLNECLLSGENLNANLVDVILKFREYKIAFCGDIARAFLQVQVSECDRNYLCFLYYKNCDKSQPIVMYHYNRHPFGVACSSYVLAATIKTHLKKYEITHARAYEMLSKSLYVDDLFYGSSTLQEAFKLSADAVSILKDANMTMRKFDSNSKELKNLWKSSNPPIEINEHPDADLKVLGLKWNNKEDTLCLNLISLFSNNQYKCTKRNVLHIVAKIFDPSGFISPFLIRMKCLLQELWQHGVGWDEEFSGEIKEKWLSWYSEIEELQNLIIPRYYFLDSENGENIQLHVFSDASLKSFGAVAYFRYKTLHGTFNTSFVISKARVAPLKRLTLPRLELMGAIIAARLVKHLKEIFKNIEKIILWSDSTIVLHWIKGTASKWKPFISNRVTEIQEIIDPSVWKHCISQHNPADLLTRGLSSRHLINSEKWWHGPKWLTYPEDKWPKLKEFDSIGKEIEFEYKSRVIVSAAITHEKVINPDKYSNFEKLLRVTAWVLRFVNLLRKKHDHKASLTSDELNNAENFWVKIIQNEFYFDEIKCLRNKTPLPKDSKLLCLNPFLDDKNILRVSGRLHKTHLSTDEKHPIILPSKSKLTELLIWNSHEKVFHSSVSHTLVQLREKYWVLKARQTIKSLLRNCVICKRFHSSPGDQVIAPLPAARVEPQANPFSTIGVDFAGPLFVKDNQNKQYILLITCAVTRSIHLELVGNLSTDTFLLAFRRFIARRGLPSVVISDNARTFKRAELELKQMWLTVNDPEVKRFCASNSITWKYIVERAAWWGGFYERMVRTVKVALRKTLGKSSLTVDQLQTVLIEIEGMVNSRPITYVGSDADEPTALTPAHFLIGKRISSLPPVKLHLDTNISSRKVLIKAFNYREKLMRSLWSRWKNEYLLNLRSAHLKSLKNNIPQFKVNDVVLIKDEHLPRNFWKLGRILELFPGRDGKVRACKIKTESSIIKRPIQLLYNLELQN